MRSMISRWFLFGLLLGWSLTHANVFGQPAGSTDAKKTTPIDKLRQGLERKITVDYSGGSLVEVLNHIRDRSGLNISLDDQALMMVGMNPGGAPDGVIQQFNLKAKDEKASTVLRKFLNTYRLCYVVFEDSILITSEDMAVMRQMRQRVSVNVEDVAAKTAIRELAKKHGINLVFDPKVTQQADTVVSLQVDNTGIETAVRLLAELASLKAVRMGNVLFVTSADKAKVIREEEQHQFDNPLNPNVPQPPIVNFGGGFGMIGGGVAPRAVPPIGIAVPGNPGVLPPDVVPPPPPKEAPEPGRNPGGDAPVKKVVIPVPPAPDQPVPARPVLDRPTGVPQPAPRREPADR